MIAELWGSFPRLLEQNINGLLDGAEPTSAKAFMLYKTCQREELWRDTFENFSRHLNDFFRKPKVTRRKSDFDRVLDRPMAQSMFGDFHLNFRTAVVREKSIDDLASWAHNLMRVGKKTNSAVISLDVMTQTLNQITHPAPHEKAEDIEFEDFCAAWKKIVFRLFGKKHDAEFEQIVSELRWLNSEIAKEEAELTTPAVVRTSIYLTQTEIDWTLAVQRAAIEHQRLPRFPLSRGPQKQRLTDLERTIALYEIVETSQFPELIAHRESIRNTILERCESLLRDKAA